MGICLQTTERTSEKSLQKDIHSLEKWTKLWLLGFNQDKCHIFTLGKFVNITSTHRYKVENYEIEHVFGEKDLCVIFDSNVSFEDQISAKINKANSISGLILRSFTFWIATLSNIKKFTAFVRPHLEYAQSVWSPYLPKYIDELENVQIRANSCKFVQTRANSCN